jgi:hypothetical protein
MVWLWVGMYTHLSKSRHCTNACFSDFGSLFPVAHFFLTVVDREDEKETLTSAVYLHTYTHG